MYKNGVIVSLRSLQGYMEVSIKGKKEKTNYS